MPRCLAAGPSPRVYRLPPAAAPARAAAMLALLLTLAACGATPSPREERPLAPPSAASVPRRMTLSRLGGGTVTLDELRGRPIVIALFTTWCFPCQAEAPSIARLHERFAPRGLAVIGVALNSQGVAPARLAQLYADEVGFRFPVAAAAPDDLELIGALGKTTLVPRTVLLDQAGRPVQDHVGETRFQALERKILELLAAPPPR